MAEAKNVSFDSIMGDLKERKFLPVYYLMGDEPYYIDQISDYIAEHVLQPEERDFNQTILFGGGAEHQEYGGSGEVFQGANGLHHPRDVP